MGAGEGETLGRQLGASAELLACGDGGLKPPVEKRVKPVSQLYCRNFIAPSVLIQLYCANFIILQCPNFNVPTWRRRRMDKRAWESIPVHVMLG